MKFWFMKRQRSQSNSGGCAGTKKSSSCSDPDSALNDVTQSSYDETCSSFSDPAPWRVENILVTGPPCEEDWWTDVDDVDDDDDDDDDQDKEDQPQQPKTKWWIEAGVTVTSSASTGETTSIVPPPPSTAARQHHRDQQQQEQQQERNTSPIATSCSASDIGADVESFFGLLPAAATAAGAASASVEGTAEAKTTHDANNTPLPATATVTAVQVAVESIAIGTDVSCGAADLCNVGNHDDDGGGGGGGDEAEQVAEQAASQHLNDIAERTTTTATQRDRRKKFRNVGRETWIQARQAWRGEQEDEDAFCASSSSSSSSPLSNSLLRKTTKTNNKNKKKNKKVRLPPYPCKSYRREIKKGIIECREFSLRRHPVALCDMIEIYNEVWHEEHSSG